MKSLSGLKKNTKDFMAIFKKMDLRQKDIHKNIKTEKPPMEVNIKLEKEEREGSSKTSSPRALTSKTVSTSPLPMHFWGLGTFTPPEIYNRLLAAQPYGCTCLQCRKREAALKRSLEDGGESETTAKIIRYYPCPPLSPSDAGEGGDANKRRCTGTQTSFSSFPHEVYREQNLPEYRLLDLDRVNYAQTTSQCNPSTPQAHNPHRRMSPNELMTSPHMISSQHPMTSHPLTSHHMTTQRSTSRSPPVSKNSHNHTDDSNHVPLNLTTSSGTSEMMSRASQMISRQQRPSVITVAPQQMQQPSHVVAREGRTSPGRVPPVNGTENFWVSSAEDGVPSIDEHFRRSLGQKYPTVYGPPKSSHPSSPPKHSPSPPSYTHSPPSYTTPPPSYTPPKKVSPHSPPPPPVYQIPRGQHQGSVSPPANAPRSTVEMDMLQTQPKELLINGTVDDHFAKSLGDKWREISQPIRTEVTPEQETSRPITADVTNGQDLNQPIRAEVAPNQPIKLDVIAGSMDGQAVDDHFAKALGETWLRIKANTEGSRSNSPQN